MYMNIGGFLEKFLKIKSALKGLGTGKSLQCFEKSLKFTLTLFILETEVSIKLYFALTWHQIKHI